jgi:16S rRNA G966 N2-methylase RsmD
LNKHITTEAVQAYIQEQLHADVHKIALTKSPFREVDGKELANQIAARKKAARKLPTWYHTPLIYYPSLLSIEQCSSEITAAYKAGLTRGKSLIDLTGGFGVDSYYFSTVNDSVVHCEINEELSAIASYNSALLGQTDTTFISGDGMSFLENTEQKFDFVYIDPARRSSSGKVFMLKDCTPNVVEHLDMLLSKANRVLIKTAPLLDLSAGLKELEHIAEIHIVSVKNECKELIWIAERDYTGLPQIVCTTLNSEEKQFSFNMGEEVPARPLATHIEAGYYLYEPDVALLKSGAFNLIAERYQLQKFHSQTQLYLSADIHTGFPGRIFKIDQVLSAGAIKKEKGLVGSVIVRNYPDKAAALVDKYQIKPDDTQFIIFTQSKAEGKVILKSTIIQHY